MNILLLNGHDPYDGIANGNLSQTFIDIAEQTLLTMGHQVKHSNVQSYTKEDEWQKYRWANALVVQFPSYWMMVPAKFKQYMEEVYTPATNGTLCQDDGRSSKNPKANYGTGGVHTGKKYLLSSTFNAPAEAFGNPQEYLFGEKSLEDLNFPVHCVYRFFGFAPLPSFGCFDVYKNPQIETDLARWQAHLKAHFCQ